MFLLYNDHNCVEKLAILTIKQNCNINHQTIAAAKMYSIQSTNIQIQKLIYNIMTVLNLGVELVWQ